jgi:hypothetical protein
MFIEVYLVDWAETTKRLKANSGLGGILGEAVERRQKWIKQLDWFSPSDNYYFDCAEIWESIRGSKSVPRAIDAKARDFMDHLITYGDYHNDLLAEAFLLSISPKSAVKFALLFSQIDFTVYRDAFHSEADDLARRTIAQYAPKKRQGRAFEDGFLSYIESFGRALGLAVKEKRGLLFTLL